MMKECEERLGRIEERIELRMIELQRKIGETGVTYNFSTIWGRLNELERRLADHESVRVRTAIKSVSGGGVGEEKKDEDFVHCTCLWWKKPGEWNKRRADWKCPVHGSLELTQ